MLAILAGLPIADVEPLLACSLLEDELIEEGVTLAEPIIKLVESGELRVEGRCFAWILKLGTRLEETLA